MTELDSPIMGATAVTPLLLAGSNDGDRPNGMGISWPTKRRRAELVRPHIRQIWVIPSERAVIFPLISIP